MESYPLNSYVRHKMTASEEENLTSKEQAVVNYIREEGGIHQAKMWKDLDFSRREGSRLAKNLDDEGIIERTKVTYEGRVTYFLTLPGQDIDLAKEVLQESSTEESDSKEQTIKEDQGSQVHSNNDLSANEREALEYVNRVGGIHQSDLWKELDISRREGSRVAKSLAEKDQIERERVAYKGNHTYYLSPVARNLDFSLLMAGDILSPFIGEEEIHPQSDAFSQWLMNLAYEDR